MILEESCPEVIWNTVLSALFDIADTLCPIREFNITYQRPVYFTHELVEMIKECESLDKNGAVSDGRVSGWREHHDLYI